MIKIIDVTSFKIKNTYRIQELWVVLNWKSGGLSMHGAKLQFSVTIIAVDLLCCFSWESWIARRNGWFWIRWFLIRTCQFFQAFFVKNYHYLQHGKELFGRITMWHFAYCYTVNFVSKIHISLWKTCYWTSFKLPYPTLFYVSTRNGFG